MTEISRIAIVGGGTAGWMTAAYLAKHLPKHISLCLVESERLGTVGVGEATIPTIRHFYRSLGLSDEWVFQHTDATFKYGIEFIDWHRQGTSFIHPFGLFGQGTQDVDFHHYWLRARKDAEVSKLSEFSLGVQLAKHSKILFHSTPPQSQLETFDWALHFDAAKFAKLMQTVATSNGVEHIVGDIVCVKQGPQQQISHVMLADDTAIEADLFIDCSGFQSLLLQKTLQVGYEDWSKYLLCDRALAVQTTKSVEMLSRTQARAQSAGWQWSIPLTTRTGNGYVYSSRFISDADAEAEFKANLSGEMINNIREFKFTPGRLSQAWSQNAVAIGLSSGFLEPLESTSIALIETAIVKLADLLKSGQFDSQTRDKFNYATACEYERVRDFIILHYILSKRTDSEFWLAAQAIDIPESLQKKISHFEHTAEIQTLPWEIFGKDSWLAILDGFEHYPNTYHSRADNMPIDYLKQHLSFMQQQIGQWLQQGKTHHAVLEGIQRGK